MRQRYVHLDMLVVCEISPVAYFLLRALYNSSSRHILERQDGRKIYFMLNIFLQVTLDFLLYYSPTHQKMWWSRGSRIMGPYTIYIKKTVNTCFSRLTLEKSLELIKFSGYSCVIKSVRTLTPQVVGRWHSALTQVILVYRNILDWAAAIFILLYI